MKKTDLYLKPGTYIKSNAAIGDIQGISLENFVVSVLNNPTCCAKPVFIKDGLLMTDTSLSTSLQTVKDQVTNSSPLKLSTTLVRVESNLEIAERLNIEADSTVTTQTSSVIQATTTNANLVIAPNGNGSIVARIPDGTAVGGNARGDNSVDLQIYQSTTGVASGAVSVCGGGRANTASNNYSVVSGGYSNISSGQFSYVGAGTSNTASSNYSTISGGQSNTASTNTHATVVGGQSNTASGARSIAGGNTSVASGSNSLALGQELTSSGTASASLNYLNQATGSYTFAHGTRAKSYLMSQRSLGGQNSWPSPFVGLGQSSELVALKLDTLATSAITVLSLDGTGTTNLIIPDGNNRAWNVQVNWVAVVTAITGTATGISVGDVVTSVDLLGFKRVGGTSSASAHTSAATKLMVTSPAQYAGCSISYTAGASQEMAMAFTGPTFAGGGSVTMRIVARVELSEVAW